MSWRGIQNKYKMSGIYRIEIVVEGKSYFYIGKSKSIGERWLTHITQLIAGTHHCKRLQFAYNKAGPLALNFSILEAFPGPHSDNKILNSLLSTMERKWINSIPKSFLLNTKQ